MSEESEKPHYSASEMLKRLRSTQEVGGRKVPETEESFDPDTGMVTVRKRKRRRKPGGKGGGGAWVEDPAWLVWTKRLVLFGFPLFVISVVVVYMVLAGAVKTDRFRDGVAASLARHWDLPAPPEVGAVTLTGTQIKSKKIAFEGGEGSVVRSAVLGEPDGRLALRSFLGGDWFFDLFTVLQLDLVLGPAAAEAGTSGNAGSGTPAGGGFLLSESPELIHVSEFTAWRADLRFGSREGDSDGPGFHGVRGALSRRETADGTGYFDGQISGGKDGFLRLPAWPDMKLESARFSLGDGAIRIAKAFFELGEAGTVAVEGTVSLAPGGETSLQVSMENIVLADLLPGVATRIVFGDGVLDAKNLELTWRNDNPAETWRLSGLAGFRLLRVKAVPFLEEMEQLMESELQAIEFNRATCRIELTPQFASISELDLQISQRLALRGQIAVDRDGWVLAGELRVGALPASFLDSPPPIFKPGDDGMVWTPVRVSGTLAGPQDDFGARMMSARLGGDGSLGRGQGESPPAGDPGASETDALLDRLLRNAAPDGE